MEYYTKEYPEFTSRKPELIRIIEVKLQCFYDFITPYLLSRWFFTLFLLVLYIIRIIITQGFHVVSYIMGIFLLNRFISFLSPKMAPEYTDDGEALPTTSSDEFRPFLRRLPEFKFWNSCTIALQISVLCTFVGFLDIPVFWPILVGYFFILFYVTMKRQIAHMIKYHYLPFTYGKPRHHSGKANLQM